MYKSSLFLNSFFFLFLITSYAQEVQFSSIIIPDSLRSNANAVIRDNLLEITIKSSEEQVIKKRSVVTVLNKKGNRNVQLFEYYDDDTRIKKLSLRVYDALGNEIKKYSKGKFIDASAVGGATLYSDARVKYLDFTPTSYPYTAIFESEVENSSTGFIPKWFPIENYSVSVENSSYKVNNPEGLSFRKKENKLAGYAITNLSTDSEIHYKIKNATAKKSEQSSPSFSKIMPSVSIALDDFSLKGVKGHASNWQEFGKWIYQKLLKGRTTLNEETIQTVKNLVKDVNTDLEKAKIIYNFMQKRTRYISVQVGIGGWAPISASEVHNVGYGDCKGLTNYTKALLDVVGVESYYTVVYAGNKKNIEADFASIQGNHVILNLPNKGDDVWLECTNQTIPFGFLGSFTHDRKVLVVKPEGGVIKRTSAYKNKTNSQNTKAEITLDTTGNLVADVKLVSKGLKYSDKFYIESKDKQELKNYYKSEVWHYNNIEIESINLKNDKDKVVFTETLKVKIDKYGSLNNNEFLFRLNVFDKFNYIPRRYRNRKQSFEIDQGFFNTDAFTFKIPENYSMIGLPLEKELHTEFGTYKISVNKIDETTLQYKKVFLLKEGVYPKEKYKLYRKFIKKVNKLDNLRIMLVKNK